ncbi:MAG: hypothetical protein HY903_21305 [Deltaproteobacteria bacterium]|nr:hypothetical protein [Deltaproteobacteria bacterium]
MKPVSCRASLLLLPLFGLATLTATSSRAQEAAAAPAAPTAPPAEAPPPIEQLVVFDLKTSGLSADLARTLSQLYAVSVREALPAAKVLSQTDIQELLALETRQQLLGCDDTSCLSQIVGALGAAFLATGSVGRIGDRTMVELRLIDANQATTFGQVSAQVAGNDARVGEALAQLAAHLVDPRRPVAVATLSIWGQGEVQVDDKPVGKAPIERYQVPPGDHLVTWHRPGDPIPTAERRVTVDAYSLTRVEPLEAQRGWDLAGTHLSIGLGTVVQARMDNRKVGRAGYARTEIGYVFPFGLSVHLGRSFQMQQAPARRGLEAVQFATDAGTLGVGYQTQGKWRLKGALDVGGGKIYSPVSSFKSTAMLLVEPSLAASYSFGRYFEVGARVAESLANAEDRKITATNLMLYLGVPNAGPDHYPQQDFHTSVLFWGVTAAVLIGSSILGGAADQIAALALQQ